MLRMQAERDPIITGGGDAVALTVAILTATAFAVFGFPFRFYQCWFSWSRWGSNTGVLIYLLFAGAGGGLLGWLAAQGANAAHSSRPAVDGILYGIAGALVVRADFRSPRAAAPRQIREAASALGMGIKWSTDLLDEVTRRKAKFWLKTLSDDELMSVAVEITQEIEVAPSSQIPANTKRATLRKITDAMELIRSSAPDDHRAEARMRLIQFCVVYFVGEHAPKPSAAPAPAATAARDTAKP